jgi:hypothetical protein
MGTHVLLESAKIAKISRFIHVSTDEVYGEQTLDQEAMSEEQVRHTLLLPFLYHVTLIPVTFLHFTLIFITFYLLPITRHLIYVVTPSLISNVFPFTFYFFTES